MLSATPVNNRFVDLKNQLALAYEGDSAQINEKLEHAANTIDEIFRQAQTAFNAWSKLPSGTTHDGRHCYKTLDFDFFELLDSVTIARGHESTSKSITTQRRSANFRSG